MVTQMAIGYAQEELHEDGCEQIHRLNDQPLVRHLIS